MGYAEHEMKPSQRSLLVPWLAAILVTAVFGQSSKVPRFQDYRTTSVYRGAVKPPAFGNPDQYSGMDLRCFGGDPAE
jgi:hypothetical protein